MVNFICGCVLGFFIGVMGFTGIAQALDKGLDTVKSINISVDK